ncbi:MAG TPA: response regulator [Chthoniobacteraceae bacterium]|jgi:DNA-binding response OmpR family regulator|nr:response regulator [Chthoniobacteraceae bacterium]
MHAFDNFVTNARFLVVDDEPVSASAVEISLAAAGQEDLHIITDPRQALAAFREYRPDIVLLDISMPLMDGFQVLEALRKEIPPDDHVPVIVITADPAEATRRRALEAGASDFLTKPFGSTELRLRVRNLLQTRFLHLGLREQNRRLDERVTERTKELEAALEELRVTQRQAIREQRLHAFSEMAGGVVHDFNNVLMILMSLADLMSRETPEAEPRLQDYVGTMQAVLQEAAQVIGRLHYFCRPRHDDDLFMPTDLKKLIEDAIHLARPKWHDSARAMGQEIRMDMRIEKVETLACNPSELREAVFHLILNAVEAMPKGGTLSVALLRAEGGVEITVGDTGSGMSEEARARCMDPFYSTKGEACVGLGLAMVHGIVRRHNGRIEVASAPDKGSTFRIFLPRDNASAMAARPRTPQTVSRTLRILLAEDDARLRQLIALQMESMGHTVETACDGFEALRKFHESPFDLILTDLSMPQLNGLALVEAARQLIAEIPVIMLTGFGAMLLPDGERPPGVDILLTKPITRDNLAAAIARVAA